MKSYKIGILGCGWIAEHAHIPALKKMQEVNLIAVFDLELKRAKSICTSFDIPNAYEILDEFLECGLDGVIISTPNYTHYAYTVEALKKKINVLCEKPVALKASEVEDIMNISQENDVIYVPGFVNRWRKDIQYIIKEIQSGVIGEIRSIDAGWLRKSGIPRPGSWFTLRELSGGGVLTDLGSHIIDICLLFLGEAKEKNHILLTSLCNETDHKVGEAGWFQQEADKKFEIDVEQTAIAQVDFEEDMQMRVQLSWRAPVKADCTYFKISGSKGNIELKTLFGFSNDRLWKDNILLLNYENEKKEIHMDDKENSTKNAFGEMLAYFIRAIENRNVEDTNYYDALKTVSCIETLYKNERRDDKRVADLLGKRI